MQPFFVAMAYKGKIFGADEARITLNTNLNGTVQLTEALVPLLRDGTGRVVNVSSRFVWIAALFL